MQQANAEHQSLQQTLVDEQQEKATLAERATGMMMQHESQQQEIERLHQLLNSVQKNLEHYQSAVQQLRQEESLKMDALRTGYEQKLNELQQHLSDSAAEKERYYLKAEQLWVA